MKKHICLLGAAAILLCTGPAFAIIAKVPKKTDDTPSAPVFACTPAGFTLTKVDAGLKLNGLIQVPTGGWTYDLDEQEPGPDGSLHGVLHLKAPEGAATEVLSQVAVDHTFTGEGDRLSVDVDGMKDKGTIKIDCKVAGSAQ